MAERDIVIPSQLAERIGLTAEGTQTMVSQYATHGRPSREDEGALGVALYIGGRLKRKIGRGIGNGIKGVIGSVFVIPGETEVAVITRRSLFRGGATEYSLAGGLLTRVTEEDLNGGTGVCPGTIALKIPLFERAEKVEVLKLQPVGGKSSITPELSGISADMIIEVKAAVNLAEEQEVIDTRGERSRRLVVDGDPIKFIRRWGGDTERASMMAIDTTISRVFANEHFIQIAQALQEQTDGIPVGQITALVGHSISPALVAITLETTGLKVRPDTISVDVEFPDRVQKFTDARLEADATRIQEGAVADIKIQEVAGKAKAIVDAFGGTEGVAMILQAFTSGRRNQISE